VRDSAQTPMAVLKEAERMVEAASDFGIRAANWEIQKQHEAQWAVPVIQVLQGLPPTRVLDLGCGYGSLAVSAALLGHEVVAVDWFVPSPAIDGIEWRHQDIQAPGSLPDGSFRLVVMTEVLEHLNFHPGALFDEVHSRLRPGGLFVGATPAPETWQEDLPVKRVEDMPSWSAGVELVDAHIHFYSEEELVSLLLDAGFAIASMVLLGGGHRRFWEARR
jgi:2-polyprenyl-3-methyl-5-hydroxy-6-metoxy-1,4-benzoquinol methylase